MALSGSTAVAIVLFSYFAFYGNMAFNEYVFFAIVVAVFPTAILSHVDYQWKRSLDEHLPDLFRTIVQAQETGMTLPQALEEASKRDYGPLTEELKIMTAQMSWGMTFDEALTALGRRVETPLVQRTVPLIIEANRSGGRVEKIFDPLRKFIQTTLLLDKERRSQTRPYTAIIYVAFFVFLFTVVLLFKSFFVNIEDLPILGSTGIASADLRGTFLRMTTIQAFFGGLVAGKISEGTLTAGLKHSMILMFCGYIGLKLFM